MTETAPAFKSTPGRVKVANEVIAQIAGLTALQIPGVAGVAGLLAACSPAVAPAAVERFGGAVAGAR